MKYITVDFTGCEYIGEIHEVLKDSFKLPEYYGENLDALWDSLDCYCDYNLHIYIKGISDLPSEFNDYMKKMWDVFCRINKANPNMTFEIIS